MGARWSTGDALQPRHKLGMGLGCSPALHHPFPGLSPQQGHGSDPQSLPKTAPNEAVPALGYELDHSWPDPVLGVLEVALGRAYSLPGMGEEGKQGEKGWTLKLELSGVSQFLSDGDLAQGAMSHPEQARSSLGLAHPAETESCVSARAETPRGFPFPHPWAPKLPPNPTPHRGDPPYPPKPTGNGIQPQPGWEPTSPRSWHAQRIVSKGLKQIQNFISNEYTEHVGWGCATSQRRPPRAGCRLQPPPPQKPGSGRLAPEGRARPRHQQPWQEKKKTKKKENVLFQYSRYFFL